MSAEIHQVDADIMILINILDENSNPIDLTAVDVLNVDLVFKKPDCTTITRRASFVTTGEDGKVRYMLLAEDLNQSGRWSVQGYVNVTSGVWHTNIQRFKVEPNLL